MNSSRVLSLAALGIAIAITVSLKTIEINPVKRATSDDLKQAVVKLLAREGFVTEIGKRNGFVVSAHRDDCRLQVQEAYAEGYNLDAIVFYMPKGARLAFAFRGQLSDRHPTAGATISSIWTRLKWRLGIDSAWSPPLAIASTGVCAVETLPWNELAEIRAE